MKTETRDNQNSLKHALQSNLNLIANTTITNESIIEAFIGYYKNLHNYEEVLFKFFHPYFTRKLIMFKEVFKLNSIYLNKDQGILTSLIQIDTSKINISEFNFFIFCLYDEMSSLLSWTKLSLLHFTTEIKVFNSKEINENINKINGLFPGNNIKRHNKNNNLFVLTCKINDFEENKKISLYSNFYYVDAVYNNDKQFYLSKYNNTKNIKENKSNDTPLKINVNLFEIQNYLINFKVPKYLIQNSKISNKEKANKTTIAKF